MTVAVLLAVDDRPDNLLVLSQLLAAHLPDIKLLAAPGAEAGLELAASEPCDGALIDVEMPGLDGIEMCRRLKADPRTASIHVILVTAPRAASALKARGLEAGADDFIAKPIDSVELAAKLGVMLRLRAAKHALRRERGHLEEAVQERTQAVQDAEYRYRTLFHAASDAIFISDLEGRLLEVNEEACRRLGYTREELLHLTVRDVVSPEYVARRAEILEQLRATGRFVFETEIITRDGRIIPTECSSRLMDLQGQPAVLSIARDISERKRAEEALHKERDQAQQYLDIAGVAFVVLDAAGRITLINKRGCEILGYEEQEILGQNWFEVCLPPDVCNEVKAVFQKLMAGDIEPVECYENPVVTKTGERRIIAFHNAVIRDQSAQIIGVVSSGEDITARRQAEEGLRTAAQKWRTTFDAIGDALFLLDLEGRMLQCNQAMADLVGKPIPEIIGRRCWEVVHNTHGPIGGCPLERLRQSRQREELILPVGEGWFKVAVDPILDEAGNLTGAVHIIADITQLKRTEAKLLNALGASIQCQTESRALLKASQVVLSKPSSEAAVKDIFTLCKSLIGATTGYVALHPEDGQGDLVVFSDFGEAPGAGEPSLPTPVSGLQEEAYGRGSPIFYNDLNHREEAPLPPGGPLGLDNILFAPLQAGGKILGLLGLANKPGGFSEDDANLAAGFAELATVSLVNQQAEEALRQSEAKYRLLMNQVPAVVFKGYADWSMDFFDQKVEALTGYSQEDFTTRTLTWKDLILPEDLTDVRRNFLATRQSDQSFEWEYRIRKKDGEIRWIHDLLQIFKDSSGKIDHVSGILFDVTDRKDAEEKLSRTTRALRALSACNQALARATHEQDFLTDVCRIIVQEGGYPLAWVGFARMDEAKSVVPAAYAGSGDENPDWLKITWGEDELGQGPGGMAIKTGQTQLARDLLHAPALAPWQEKLRRREFNVIIALPLIVDGKTIGILDIFGRDSEAFDSEEVSLLEELAGEVAFGIWSLRTDEGRQRAEAEARQSLEKLREALEGTVSAVAGIVEMRDPYTAGHQQRVAQLACAIAREMGFSSERLEGMRVLGCLHDIGKISIPAEILSKPGKLSETEFSLIKDHARLGYEIIKDIDFPYTVAQGILQHHERVNGSGYPMGISGEDITQEAKILAVADVVEAMASHRPYRSALGLEKALEEISRNRGVLYDPEVVDICLKIFSEPESLFQWV
ncbi:MAG: PAS domain S-box protein [Deltaproteobacteria bacterium]|nr:PAS domain S-box protein [Deltaproteobacteria bacterium]